MLISHKWVSKYTLKFQFQESWQKCIFSTLQPTLNEGQNNSKSHKNRCPCLSLKWVPKSVLKTQFWESRQKCIFSTLVRLALNAGKIAPIPIKIGVHTYLSNGYLNPLSKLNFEKVEKVHIFNLERGPKQLQNW